MKTYTLNIENENIIDKVLWMLSYFKDDGVVVREIDNDTSIDVKSSITQAVKEINMIHQNKLSARPVEDLISAL